MSGESLTVDLLAKAIVLNGRLDAETRDHLISGIETLAILSDEDRAASELRPMVRTLLEEVNR